MPYTQAPSINRAIQGLAPVYQRLISDLYLRILPVLLQLLRPRDILERNRAWPGVSPLGKGATELLTAQHARVARKIIRTYAAKHNECDAELWQLLRAYCRFGPIGLIHALPSTLPPLIADELQEYAAFVRLGKHPRTDAGLFIRELLTLLADDLGLQHLTPWLARYAWATNRRTERWFVAEEPATEAVSKTHRRLNLQIPYPHHSWHLCMSPLPITALLAHRHPHVVTPWLMWMYDLCSGSLMGVRICNGQPTIQDVLLTLRWSIWHYSAPWWKARGVPDTVISNIHLPVTTEHVRALRYLHTEIAYVGGDAEGGTQRGYPAFPNDFKQFLSTLTPSTFAGWRNLIPTTGELYLRILEYLQEQFSASVSAATPSTLAEQGVTLPWSSGIAATLLLPAAGIYVVAEGTVVLWGIPYDAAGSGLPDGTSVTAHIDPDDARGIYLRHSGAYVVRALAAAFEGNRMPWIELVADPAVLDILMKRRLGASKTKVG